MKESGRWLENVDRTHLVLASGKLVLQKSLEAVPGIDHGGEQVFEELAVPLRDVLVLDVGAPVLLQEPPAAVKVGV